MTPECVTVAADLTRALIRAMGMQAENQDRTNRGLSIDSEGVGYNEVRRNLYGS
jgi:hypothetical protein